MNNNIEDKLEAWGNEKEMVPEFFSKGIDDALRNLPDVHTVQSKPKKTRKVAKVFVASAAALTFGIIGSGFVSPTMAKVLAEVPIVGSIFADSSDSTLKLVEQKGLASTLNETVTDNGVSLTITEAFFGGGRLAIGYTIETDNVEIQSNLKESKIPLHFQAQLDQKRFTYLADFEQSMQNNVLRGIIDMGIGLESELSDNPTLQFNVDEISGIKGSWNFSIPVSNKNLAEAAATFKPMVTTTWDKATFVVEKAEFTPAQSQVIIDRTMPREDIENYSYAIYNENGTSLGFAGGSGSSIIDKGNGFVNFKDTILLPGREEAPKGLIIELMNNNGTLFDESIIKEVEVPLNEGKLPYTLSYPDDSHLIITGFEQLKDKTVVYYDVQNRLGLQNAFFMLEDENGERYSSEKDAVRTDATKLSFKKEFPKTTGSISLLAQVEKKSFIDTKVIKIELK